MKTNVSVLSGQDHKIKLRRFALHLYFSGELGRYVADREGI